MKVAENHRSKQDAWVSVRGGLSRGDGLTLRRNRSRDYSELSQLSAKYMKTEEKYDSFKPTLAIIEVLTASPLVTASTRKCTVNLKLALVRKINNSLSSLHQHVQKTSAGFGKVQN